MIERAGSATTSCAAWSRPTRLIGTFAALDDASLDANRCFLYHVIGNGTGDWDVPIGGMGAVSGELERAARAAGATHRDRRRGDARSRPTASVQLRARRRRDHEVRGETRARERRRRWCSQRLLGRVEPPTRPAPEGAQVKVNLLLSRLPRLRDASVAPEAAFGGTFHINELYTQLGDAYDAAAGGGDPRAAAVRDLLPLADRPVDPRRPSCAHPEPTPSPSSGCTFPTGW